MKWTTVCGLSAFCISVALAEDIKTTDGKEYKNANVSRAEPDGIVVITDSGIVKLYFTELPEDIRQKYHYDPTKASAFASSESEKQRVIQEAADAARRENAGKQNEYWATHTPSAPANAQGGSLYQKQWIDGKVLAKTKEGIFIESSGKSKDNYPGAVGLIILRGHPNFAMLADGDHVEVIGVTTGTITLGIPKRGKRTIHAYQYSP